MSFGPLFDALEETVEQKELTKKEKKKASNKAYREANKEKLKAKKNAYYEANKDKLKANHKAYIEANKEKLKAQRNAYREANKEKVKAQIKAWREANKEKVKAQNKASALKREYSLTIEDFNKKLDNQSNRCACCGREFNQKLPPCVDHCHKNGHVRGILCIPCNTALGMIKDSPAVALALAAYLEKTGAA